MENKFEIGGLGWILFFVLLFIGILVGNIIYDWLF
jgi:hypothetical protein